MTPDAARQKQIEIYRIMSAERRLQVAFELYELACEVSRCGIRYQHPEATPMQVEKRLQERIALARRE